MGALEAQVKKLGLQAAQDCERLARDRALTLQLLQKVGPLGLTLGMRATVPHADSPRVCLTGAGEAVRPGEEVPRLDGGEELVEKQWRRRLWRRRGGGERLGENL